MLLLSNLRWTNYTVVCDQIANKSFILLNASILRKYRKKPSSKSASYSNLSNCNYRIFVQKILLEISFIDKMRTTWGN